MAFRRRMTDPGPRCACGMGIAKGATVCGRCDGTDVPAPEPIVRPAPDPACWSWPIPELAATSRYGTPEDDQFDDFHAGRCAVCGTYGPTIEEHDHRTGLVRGYCCRSCNGREGTMYGDRGGPTLARYRERNPATILGYVRRYWNPFLGEYDQGTG